MKEYSKSDYESYESFESEALRELKGAFVGAKVLYRSQNAHLADFRFADAKLGGPSTTSARELFAEFDVGGTKKEIILRLGISSGVIEPIGAEANAISELIGVLDRAKATHDAEIEAKLREAEERAKAKATERALENAKKAEELKVAEAEKRRAKRIGRALAKLDRIEREDTSKAFAAPESHYEALGWMAKHLSSIRASMPDYMEKWFVGKFGDVERHIIDSRRTTAGGYPMQWGLSMKLTFDEDVKGQLEARATGGSKRIIDSVAFVWDLVENYGFRFGKEQDVESIMAEIPKCSLPDFERGYGM